MTINEPEGAVRKDTVLVVDDEEDIRDGVAEVLETSLQDVDIVTAASGKEALRCVEGGGIDLIISDYRMPGMDGLELLRRVSDLDPDIPRILMTAYGDMEIAMEAINDAHVHNFFSKPFEPDKIIDTVWEVLDAHWEHVQTEERNSKSLKALGDDDGHSEAEHKNGRPKS